MSYLVTAADKIQGVHSDAAAVIKILDRHTGFRAWILAIDEVSGEPVIGEEVTLGDSKQVSVVDEVELVAGDVVMGTGQVRKAIE